jgi:peptidoglycan/xylan/chitin deacetylase (PgdA/CDA1 family)
MFFFRNVRRLFNPLKSRILSTITNVETINPVIALTFDDGPNPKYTPRLLKILAKYKAYGTFFMLGKAAQQYPEIVKQVAQGGHAIGNHSWDHPSFPLISGQERRAQIRACANATTPFGSKLLRPPYGHQSVGLRLDALWLGYKIISWNVVAYDWIGHDTNWIINKLIPKIRPGCVILFHDSLYDVLDYSYFNRSSTLEAIERLLEMLSDNYSFITLPELLKHGKLKKQNWSIKPDVEFLNRLKVQAGQARQYLRSR